MVPEVRGIIHHDREMQFNEEMGEGMPITGEEVGAIARLKDSKSPGISGISAEMMKGGKMVRWIIQ